MNEFVINDGYFYYDGTTASANNTITFSPSTTTFNSSHIIFNFNYPPYFIPIDIDNFITHKWKKTISSIYFANTEHECERCNLKFRIEDNKIIANKDISCSENKLNNLLE